MHFIIPVNMLHVNQVSLLRVLVQIRTQATLAKLYEWIHALTSHTQRALHTVEPSDNEMTLALSRALEVLSRLSELTDTKLQYS